MQVNFVNGPSISWDLNEIILLNAIQINDRLNILNWLSVRDFKYDHKLMIKYYNFDSKILSRNTVPLKALKYAFKSMSFVISELIKNTDKSILNQNLLMLFNCKSDSKLLTLGSNGENYIRSFIFNFIEMFSSLETLIISYAKIDLFQAKILEKKIRKLENLRTIKLCYNKYKCEYFIIIF